MESSGQPQFGDWLNQLAKDAVAGVVGKGTRDFEKYVAGTLSSDVSIEKHRRQFKLEAGSVYRKNSFLRQGPRAVPVIGVQRPIVAKIASNREELRAAFELVARNYQAAGYEGSMSCKVRFTPYHALPDSVTFIAEHDGNVLMTMTLVPDNTLLGLPLESLFGEEVARLRRARRRLAEVISLAAHKDLDAREFRPVFLAMSRLLFQYHLAYGGDTLVITVNPRHSKFYIKTMGYQPLGPCRPYEQVQGHPAEAYLLDVELARLHAPKTYDKIFAEWVPGAALVARPIPPHLVRYLSEEASEIAKERIRRTFDLDGYFSSPRRW